jgi:iron complex outermembrane receptor protein
MASSTTRLVLAALFATGVAQSALAQDTAATPPAAPVPAEPAREGIEEIIVTGTKREQVSQDVPISITAISEAMIDSSFRTDVLALGEMTPGVALGQVAGFRAIAGGVRGTGQNSILVTQDSSVVLLVDEFALSNVQAQFVELFDVERVEIYRGPQGTLFGKSATGGAISIVTKRPNLEEMTADLEFQYGVFNGDDGPKHSDIQKYMAAVNVPLIDGKLAVRATAILDRDDGYYTNDKDTATFGTTAPGAVPYYSFCSFVNPAPGAPTLCPAGVSPGAASNPSLLPPGLGRRTVGSGEKLNDTDVFATKLKVLWQPNEMYEAYFLFDWLDDNSGSPPGVNESEPGMLLPLLGFDSIQATGHDDVLSTGVTNQCFEGNKDGFCVADGHKVDVEGYMLHQTLTLDSVTLKLIAGWRNQEEILASTYTGEAYASLFDASRNTTKRNTQVELRAATDLDGPVNFVAGASWSREQTDMLAYATVGLLSLITFTDVNRNDTCTASVTTGCPPAFDGNGFLNLDTTYQTDPATTGAKQDRKTWAFYADGTVELGGRFSLTGGFRYTKDEKDFFRRANSGGPCTPLTPAKDQVLVAGQCLDARSNAISRVGGGFSTKDLKPFDLPLPNSAYGINSSFDDSWESWTGRIVLDVKTTDESHAYFSFATGFIPGGFTETCSSPQTCLPFDSETNWNLELGFKGQFLDNRLQTNAAIFFTQYEDLIRSQVVPFTDPFGVTTQETINVNAGVSQATGFELEGTWLPIEGLSLSANFAYLHHDYEEFVLNGNDLSGNKVPFSPKLKWGLNANYEHQIPFGSLAYNLIYSHQDEVEMSVFNSPLTQMTEWDTIDANITFRPTSERFSFTFWMKNLTDERTRIAANSVAGLWNFTMYGRPRSYGLQVGVSFGGE